MSSMSIRRVPTHSLRSVSFSTYTPEEILKLSVLEVKSPHNFNALGHPVPGGIYDPALGPNDKNELCTTCGQNYVHCPGHMGHIKMPLPVFNPVFFNTLFQLLRGSCLACHSLLAPLPASLLLYSQLRVLEFGLIGVAQELEETITELKSQTDTDGGIQIQSKLEEVVNRALQDVDVTEAKQGAHVKNVIECRQRFIRQFVKEQLMHTVRSCPHCKASKLPLHNLNQSRIVLGTATQRKVIVPKTTKTSKANEEAIVAEVEVGGVEDGEEATKTNDTETLVPDGTTQTIFTPLAARKHLVGLWETEKGLLQHLYPVLANSKARSPMDVFFLEYLPVPPSKFRPISKVGEKKFENPQSAMLSKVVQTGVTIRYLINVVKTRDEAKLPDDVQMLLEKIAGRTNSEKLQSAWINLQTQVNCVVDSDQDTLNNDKTLMGVKQLIEKKQGLFRKHMMGKRVNYAARSVISPDPYINVEEIGVPEVFATKLTYPQPVTPWNVKELRKAVLNGPDVHPGASLVKNEDGSVTMLSKNATQREAIAKQLLTPSLDAGLRGCKTVFRHLKNGDVLLVNRQPTLHKPSIMAHKARVLPGEKTLRLHYSNCKTYNADFDGDEMNIHFPQNELARSEAHFIANVTNQYLVPKDGTPLGGLIQDHMVAGVRMTMRGKFFTRYDYHQLTFVALVDKQGLIRTLPPAIMKPVPLWSGKQVISTVLMNLIPEGKAAITLKGKSKIPAKNWQKFPPRDWQAGGSPLGELDMTEYEVIFRQGEFLCGILDKAHYGPTPYGLIHSCYELYGGAVAGNILTALGRLFTQYLQTHGFTLGIEDIIVIPKADKKRRKVMRKAQIAGNSVAAEAFGVDDPNDIETICEKLQSAHRGTDDRPMKALDMAMKLCTDKVNNSINKLLMPDGLLKQFPDNNLQLMVQSGAKGSTVNTMQISCLLGQIELEGRRPPLMMSGRTLPSFVPYDVSPRAGGFVDGRFLTGIRPQEYFFHCMAGREGLIDTAVKTSRSGYLQRCLIKHLEGVYINYDLTVRDSDGSLIQFMYGEDGLDIQKVPFLKKELLHFLAINHAAILDKNQLEMTMDKHCLRKINKRRKAIKKWKKHHTSSDEKKPESAFLHFCKQSEGLSNEELHNMWRDMDDSEKDEYYKLTVKCPDPIAAKYRPDLHFGSISEHMDSLIENYLASRPNEVAEDDDDKKVSETNFRHMMYQKVNRSLCEPGEAVGLLAAQSIGEPSTQMTLNTFHFAGRGEMNVTLGIPRMREILMTASQNIATPSMDIPFLPEALPKADELRLKMNRACLNQVLEKAKVTECIRVQPPSCFRIYKVKLKLLPPRQYSEQFCLNSRGIMRFIEHKFVKQLINAMVRKFRLMSESKLISMATKADRRAGGIDEAESDEQKKTKNTDDNASSDEEERGVDDDATDVRFKSRHEQEQEYDDPEEEERQAEQSEDEGIQVDDSQGDAVRNNKDFSEEAEGIEVLQRKDVGVKTKSKKEKTKRVNFVVNLHTWIQSYDYDVDKERWCEITLKLSVQNSKIDFMSLVSETAKKAVVYEVPNIKRAIITETRGTTFLKTEGVNLTEMFKYEDILDLRHLYSNDIHSLSKTYGIEAAARAIVKEIQEVFRVYGIEVDPRHLLLIADYMTFDGTYRPFNRMGLESNTSPLQQMSFETTMHFLKSATLAGYEDQLKSPSAQLVVGKMVGMGTGCFDVIHPLR